MQFKSSSVTTAPIASNNKIPDVMDTNDFRHIHGLVDAAFTNSAAGQEEFHAAGTAHPPGTAGTAAAAEATSAEASVDVFHMSNDMSKSAILQRGESHLRAFLDRAMLGPPLPESEAPTERGVLVSLLPHCECYFT